MHVHPKTKKYCYAENFSFRMWEWNTICRSIVRMVPYCSRVYRLSMEFQGIPLCSMSSREVPTDEDKPPTIAEFFPTYVRRVHQL